MNAHAVVARGALAANERRCRRSGTTLIELAITMALLGVIAGVTVLAIRRFDPVNPLDPRQMLADSQRVSVATGRSSRVRIAMNGTMTTAWIRPDGSIVADSALAVERFTGRPEKRR